MLQHSGNFAVRAGLSTQLAGKMLTKSVELHTKVLGPDHRYTLVNKQDLAYCHYMNGKYKDAEILDKEILNSIDTIRRYVNDWTIG